MRIYVKWEEGRRRGQLTNATILRNVSGLDLIRELKAGIWANIGIYMFQQRLYVVPTGEELHDDDHVNFYDLRDGSEILLRVDKAAASGIEPKDGDDNRSATDRVSSGAWIVCLDETKRYFVLRRSEDRPSGEGQPLLTIKEGQAEETFKEICDHSMCGVPSLDHVYCYGCDAVSHGICPEHPLVFVIDRPVKMQADAYETLPEFLRLKRSTIPSAGQGVFTDIFLPAGSAFGPYGGFLVRADDSDEADSNYSWEVEVPKGSHEMNVDASDPKRSNFLRWINCARFKEEQNMLCLQFHKRIYYVVFKPVDPSEELLVWYGDAYAHRLGVPNVRRAMDLYAPPKAKRDPKAIMASWPK